MFQTGFSFNYTTALKYWVSQIGLVLVDCYRNNKFFRLNYNKIKF